MPDATAAIAAMSRANAQRGPSPADVARREQITSHVAMRMEVLLNGDGWEVYKAHVEAWKKEAQDELDAARDKTELGGLVGEEAQRAVLRQTILRDRVENYTRILALPQFLIEQGKAATDAA